MSSNERVLQWEQRWSQARLVTRVRAEATVAQSRLRLAESNVERARRERSVKDFDAALIFAEQALINAADAILARDGFRAGSHVARFTYPGLPAIYAAQRGLIDQIRSMRNQAQYDSGGEVDEAFATRALDLATQITAEVVALFA